jgi:hypothetical protein
LSPPIKPNAPQANLGHLFQGNSRLPAPDSEHPFSTANQGAEQDWSFLLILVVFSSVTGSDALSGKEYHELYIGHATKTVAENHYVIHGEPDPQFDEAIEWLGEKLGLAEIL